MASPCPFFNFPSSISPSQSQSLGLDSSLLILLEEPANTSINALLHCPQGLVAKHRLGLCDVVVASHAGDGSTQLGKGSRLLDDAEEDLRGHAEEGTHFAAEFPDAFGTLLVAGSAPHRTGKVPKVHGGVVCDEEDFAVDTLVVEGLRGSAESGEQAVGREQVGVGNVADVGKVEEVVVVANLDVGLAALVGAQQAREVLDVAFAKDAGGTERCCEQLVGVGAVGLDDELFSGSLENGGSMLANHNGKGKSSRAPLSRSSTPSAGRRAGQASARRRCAGRACCR